MIAILIYLSLYFLINISIKTELDNIGIDPAIPTD
jgi:hypothetical protein